MSCGGSLVSHHRILLFTMLLCGFLTKSQEPIELNGRQLVNFDNTDKIHGEGAQKSLDPELLRRGNNKEEDVPSSHAQT